MMKLTDRQKKSQLPKKYDGVIEAVRLSPEGTLVSARIYERRGPTWSDRIILPRFDLIQRMKSGQKFVIGERTPLLASTFAVKTPVHLVCTNGSEILVSGDSQADRDTIKAPLF